MDLKVYEVKQMPVLDPSLLSASERSRIEKAFENIVVAVDNRVKAEDQLEEVRSKTGRDVGLFEADARKELAKAVKAEEEARKKLDETVYDILELSQDERRQVEEGLRELQELRRLRTQA